MDKKTFVFLVLLAVLKSFGSDTPAINVHADHFFSVTVVKDSK
ncbi:hypothetical protein [Pantoea stewartii]|uniref:Uncharacterized protein n=1 Tax=Pantoea stewartii subsp. stewartii DC283 TaxID=660596 RepID=H3RLI7_PANSE|nr:hypothetical protein [Pantoea stewartii]EHT97700.1 hypothetical protein CKS_5561 [Pantoea stewartii subsp. stewartii DC283]